MLARPQNSVRTAFRASLASDLFGLWVSLTLPSARTRPALVEVAASLASQSHRAAKPTACRGIGSRVSPALECIAPHSAIRTVVGRCARTSFQNTPRASLWRRPAIKTGWGGLNMNWCGYAAVPHSRCLCASCPRNIGWLGGCLRPARRAIPCANQFESSALSNL